MNDWFWYALLIPAGFAAGIINTIAGGGSFLTLPALSLLCGLDWKAANGTNRIAILLSSASASATFHKHGHLDRSLALKLAIPTLLGVPAGARLAIALPTSAIEPIFGILFLLMAALIATNPKRLLASTENKKTVPASAYIVFFAIGIYVGFIQAGMGILILIAMNLVGAGSLAESNGTKNLIGFLVTLTAVIVFVAYNQVYWIPGCIMAIGNIAGGYVGAKLAIKKGNKLILTVLLIVMVGTGCKLLWPQLANLFAS